MRRLQRFACSALWSVCRVDVVFRLSAHGSASVYLQFVLARVISGSRGGFGSGSVCNTRTLCHGGHNLMQNTPYLIDWLTLRIALGGALGEALTDRIRSCLNVVHCISHTGEMLWQKYALDVDALRSDTPGLVWMLQSDGKQDFLVIGASPASLQFGLNVFGSCDIKACATVLIRHAAKSLHAVLPGYTSWQCRRVDITGNFALPGVSEVKQCLRQLCLADGGRRKASNASGGDSVYWNAKSDLTKGKAYHKGPQLAHLVKKGVLEVEPALLSLADRILRLEHTRGARWFRRLAESGRAWFDLSVSDLEALFVEFFGRVVDGVEVRDMDRHELLRLIETANATTPGRALAAYHLYVSIRTYGFEVMKESTPPRSWYRHLKMLRQAGISDADLQQGNVLQFKPVRIVLAQPVQSWDDLRRVA